jgi:TP901 family phage tail tape measure protein
MRQERSMASTIGKLLVELGLEDSQFRGGIKGATAALEQLQATGRSFAQTMDGVVAGSVAGLGAALAAFGVKTVQTGSDFEAAFTKVGALAGATTTEMAALEKKARELGATTKYSATESAVAMQELAAAGLSPAQILTATQPALLLAAAAGTDLATSTGLMASTFAQFGLEATDATRVADVFSTAMNNSLLDVSSLTEAMKYAGTAGAGFGMSLEQTTAAVSLFRDLGLEGSMAGTNFRSALEAVSDVTDKAEGVLAKYGITVQQVNPELHSFAEIMETVGKASITTSDAIAVFGSRSGANVAQIARAFADGSTNYYSLLDAMQEATGSTQQLYDTMTNTVSARLEQVSGATEELMLSVFDSFKGPLAGLLDEVAATVAYVAAQFGRLSGSGADFSALLVQVTDYLRANRQAIAVGFADLASTVVELLGLFVRWLPAIVAVGKAMLAVWVADRVRTFVVAVQGGITALSGMAGGIRAVMTALTAATGGIYAVVAAVGTLVAALIYFTTTSAAAEAQAERLRAAEAQLAAEQDARAATQRAAADALAQQQAVRLSQLELQLQAEGALNGTLDQQLARLQALSPSAVEAGLASGELFAATLNGTQVVLDHATALQLQYDATSQAEGAAGALRAAQGAAQAEVARLSRELDRYNAAIKTYDTFTAAGGQATVAYSTQIKGLAGSIEEARLRAGELARQVDTARARMDGLAQGAQVAANQLAKKEIAATLAAGAAGRMADADTAAGGAAKRSADEAVRAYEARLRAVERVEDAIARRQAGATQQAALELAAQLAELARVFDAEVKAYGAQAAKVAAAERERARVVALVRADAARQQQQDQQGLVNQLQAALLAAGRTASEREAAELQARRDARRAALQLEFDQELALYERGSAERMDVLVRFLQARTLLEQVEAAEAQQRVRERYADINATIEQLQLEDAQQRMNALDQIELERLRALADASEATAAQVAQINAVYDQRILRQKQQLSDEVVLLTAGENRKVLELERERDAMLARLGEDQLAEREAVIAYYTQAIADANAGAVGDTEQGSERMAAALRTVAGAAATVATAIGRGIAGAVQRVTDLFAQLTGFSFGLRDAVAAAQSGLAEAADLQAQLAAGELSPEDYQTALADLPATAAQGAAQYVQELVAGASDLLATFVDAAPAALQALADELPALVAQFAAALPQLAGSLAGVVGQLVQALVAAVPVVVQALADSLGVVVQALLEQLPAIVGAVLQALQAALPAVLQAVLALVDLLPVLVDAVARAIPQLVQLLVQVVQALVPALVDAAIAVVQVVVQQLPSIVQALVAGALQVLQVLLQELPRLVLAVVQMMPQIVEALLQAVVLLVQELVLQLPSIIEALLLAITDIVVALVAMLPQLITSIVTMLPQLLVAIIRLIPAIIGGVANALPQIVTALIGLIPTLVVSFITELVPAIIKALPTILYEVTVGLLVAVGQALVSLGQGIGQAVVDGLQALVQFFRDVLAEIFTLGKADTASFGDTPGAVKAGAEGMAARFAPGDYIIAAQRPADLLQQALDAMQGQLANGLAPAARGYLPGELEVPAAAGLASAMLQAATAMTAGASAGPAAGAGAQQLRVVVQANGRTLDEALFAAERRGDAPRLQQELRRTTLRAGVHVGFDRGRFTP